MKCRYCGGDVTAKTVATSGDKLVTMVTCVKCGTYVDKDAPRVCNNCGNILKGDVCKTCGVRWYAKSGLKSERVKIATKDDITSTLASLVNAVVLKDDNGVVENLKKIAKIVPQVYDDE